MNILLIQSYLGGDEPSVFPLGAASLAAGLTNHRVRIFDSNIVEHPFRELLELIRSFSPAVVGISLRNIDSTNKSEVVFYYRWLRRTLDSIRAVTNVPIIIGGSGFSMFAQEIMEREQQIDFGVYLEGEQVFSALLDNLETPRNVRGVYYRSKGKVHFTGNAPPVDINAIPAPVRDRETCNPYRSNPAGMGVETKRGCALGCIYCVYGFLNGHRYRLKNPVDVVQEIEDLVLLCGVDRFTFVDSIFNIPLAHAREICSLLAERKLPIHWSAWLSEKNLDLDFVQLLVRAGCDHFIFSPDGFADPVLKKLGKISNRKDILCSLALMQTINNPLIQVSYNFFRNPPGQSAANFFGMLFFCVRAKLALKQRCHFEFSVLRIEPHTGLYRISVDEGVISEGQSLLEPVYYSNRRTRYLEIPFNYLLSLLGK